MQASRPTGSEASRLHLEALWECGIEAWKTLYPEDRLSIPFDELEPVPFRILRVDDADSLAVRVMEFRLGDEVHSLRAQRGVRLAKSVDPEAYMTGPELVLVQIPVTRGRIDVVDELELVLAREADEDEGAARSGNSGVVTIRRRYGVDPPQDVEAQFARIEFDHAIEVVNDDAGVVKAADHGRTSMKTFDHERFDNRMSTSANTNSIPGESTMKCLSAVVWTAVSFSSALCHSLSADEWPQWRGPRRDGVWRETGLLEKFDPPRLPLRWSVPIGGGYSGPTVATGRVYVTDRLTRPKEIERVLCFDWKTGRKIWSHSYEAKYGEIKYRAGPRASVLVDGGLAYSLGALGHLYCFAAADGKILWHKDLKTEYRIRMPIWGVSASPVVEKDLLIVQIGGEDDACLVAFDKKTGKEKWKALPDDASYSAPIVIDQAGKRVLVCRTADNVVGLAPATGAPYWTFPFPSERWPISIATPVVHGDLLLISEAHLGSLLLRLRPDRPAVEKVWHRRNGDGKKDALHCLQSTPLIQGDFAYGVDNEGIFRCLELETGLPRWEDSTLVPEGRWATMHLVSNGDRTWIFNERGELIIAKLSPRGVDEISRAKLLAPTMEQLPRRGGVTWSHPGFAYRHVFARNDEQLVCADLSAR